MWQLASKYFIRGIFILLPLFITIWMLSFIFSFFDGIFGGFIWLVFGKPMPGVGFIATISIIFLTGYLTHYIFGEKVLRLAEKVLYKVPLVKTIYSSTKQINDVLFLSKDAGGFNKACIVEYPRKGIWSVGFITTEAPQEVSEKTGGEKLLSVFIPNTPTPATGFLIMVPEKDIIMLNMKTEDALKLVVSGGALKPKEIN